MSTRDGNREIYTMGPDGSNSMRLTNTSAVEEEPSWSPDGTKIAFLTNRDGNAEVYVMDGDGANQINLTNAPAYDSSPSWSPDGTRIAFDTERDGIREIYAMNVDGTSPVRLTSNTFFDQHPTWSPDSTRIAFVSNRGGNTDIYVMDANGLNEARLTTHPSRDHFPAWSPDGSKIAFTSFRTGNPEIYVMNADGTNQVSLSGDSTDDEEPSWSPDGSKIAFTSSEGAFPLGQLDVSVMNSAGGAEMTLTSHSADDYSADWQAGEALERTEDLPASQDSYIRSGAPDTNEGGAPFLQLQASGNNRALVRFDQGALEALVGSGELLSARLEFDLTENGDNWGSSGRSISVHRLTSEWAEGDGFVAQAQPPNRGTGSGATWACATDTDISDQGKDCSGVTEWEMGKPSQPELHPWVEPATASALITNGQSGVVSFDVTADVAAFLSGAATNDGWIVKKDLEGQPGQLKFASRETGNPAMLVLEIQG